MQAGADLDARMEILQNYLLHHANPDRITDFNEMLDLSWIYHDCALEGIVLTYQELRDALSGRTIADAATAQAFEEARRLKQAIMFVREAATKRKAELHLDLFKHIYSFLDPEEQNPRNVKYRKDVPLHRMYFHEISPPDKISYRMRKLQEYIQQEEEEKCHPLKLAARVQFKFLSVFPFTYHSGRVGRLITNFVLLRGGSVPAVIHSIERQRYYESLRGSMQPLTDLVQESVQATVEAYEKFFQIHLATLPQQLARQAEQRAAEQKAAALKAAAQKAAQKTAQSAPKRKTAART
jgi:Fic family protein